MDDVVFSVFYCSENGISTYPSSALSRDVYKRVVSLSESDGWIVTHREGDLMYYFYVYRLPSSREHYFGLSMHFNGKALMNFSALFRFFRVSMYHIIMDSGLVHLTMKGLVLPKILDVEAARRALDEMYAQYSIAGFSFCKLPSRSQGIDSSEVGECVREKTGINSLETTMKYSFSRVQKWIDSDCEDLLFLKLEDINDLSSSRVRDLKKSLMRDYVLWIPILCEEFVYDKSDGPIYRFMSLVFFGPLLLFFQYLGVMKWIKSHYGEEK